MLIFHEDNLNIAKIHCPSNVFMINLSRDGLANLIVNAISSRTDGIDPKLILHHMEVVLSEFPYLLAQYKVAVSIYFDFLIC